jgi:hypothetical protein
VVTGWKGEVKEVGLQLLVKLLIGKRRLMRRLRKSTQSGWKRVPDLWCSMLERAIRQLAA